ncbi:hypothetical protein SE17_10310 [Kouleothrix aurantiaca]|uniref:Uncharacterized protein n=1 Tax=Kouleothrix aurantiaca TaxID=186479 RepID=A0A0P9FJK7_9CHLR|nr:hypothetical protein SE17_10310 [Kouleothrix aurantiaca]
MQREAQRLRVEGNLPLQARDGQVNVADARGGRDAEWNGFGGPNIADPACVSLLYRASEIAPLVQFTIISQRGGLCPFLLMTKDERRRTNDEATLVIRPSCQ